MINHKNRTITHQIILALILGSVVGLSANLLNLKNTWIDSVMMNGLFLLLSKWFIALLMMLVVPLVFVSLVKGIAALNDTTQLGKISFLTLTLYLGTTLFAVSTGVMIALFLAPGQGLGLIRTDQPLTTAPSFIEMLIAFVPSNPIAAMAEGNMLQVIIFALIFGLALSLVNRQKQATTILRVFDELDAIILRMVSLVMMVAPLGVFALMTRTVFSQGIDVFVPLLTYFFTVVIALSLHAFVTYSVLLKALTGLSPFVVMLKLKEMATFSFSTASSAATIPITLATTKRLGIPESISGFTIPLGATINMDGTAIMQGVASVFIANAYGIALQPTDFLLIIMTATIASIGTAAVPGAGLIMLTMVLTQVGLPIDGVALILGVDRLLDMMRTTVNVTGDVVVSTIVANQMDTLDRHAFYDTDLPSSNGSGSV